MGRKSASGQKSKTPLCCIGPAGNAAGKAFIKNLNLLIMNLLKRFLCRIKKTGKINKSAAIFPAVALASILIILLSLTSCTAAQSSTTTGTGENTGDTITGSEQAQEPGPLDDGRTINIWDYCQPKERIFLMESISSFTEANPGLNINTRHFRSEEEMSDIFSASSLSGAGPEIVLAGYDSMKKLAGENILKNLSDEIDYNIFLDGLTELCGFDGKNYIIPFSSSDFLVFYYNRDIVSEAPGNFGDVITISKELLNSKEQKYGFVINALEPDWIIPFLGGYLDWFYEYSSGDIRLNSTAMENTLNFINNIFNVEKIMPPGSGYEELNNMFKSGKAAMIINGVWALDEYKSAQVNLGVSKIPRLLDASASPTPMITGLGFMVNSNTSAKSFETAKKFISFMVSPDIQASWTLNTSSYPAIKGLETGALSGDSTIYNILLQAKACRGKPMETDMAPIRDVLRINMESVLSGNILPVDAKEKMQEDLIKLKSGEIEIKDYSATTTTTAESGSTKKENATTTTNN